MTIETHATIRDGLDVFVRGEFLTDTQNPRYPDDPQRGPSLDGVSIFAPMLFAGKRVPLINVTDADIDEAEDALWEALEGGGE